MKVLVTGGTGFAGSHLVKRLTEEGHRVRCLVRPSGNTEEIAQYGPELFYGDITDRAGVLKAVKDMEWVFNIAAAYRKASLTEKEFHDVNFEGAKNIIGACLEHRIKKLVHCSTIGVVTSVKNPPADENTPVCPGDAYQTSKCDAELEVIRYAKEKNLPATVIRPCAIYGPGDWRLLKMFKLIAKRRFVFFGSGKAYFHMVYIDNLMDAFILAAQKDEANGEVFIIGDENYLTLNELAALIAEEFDVPVPKIHLPYRLFELLAAGVELVYRKLKIKKEPPIYKRRMAFFKKSRAFSIEKAKRILGYRPAVDIKTGIHLTAQWYTDKGFI
ncbi:MAG: NAD-dependent epimerase/dehydratase family protein [Actinobacteria bacterium]|nr:NAD-dependent epimerase/dehydratase family protein [Actinomycetota bacterium]